MRYLSLCTDYDGTLATDGRVLPETVAALERLVASGRQAVLVTGRELDELKSVCPCLELFEYVVAENGALLYHPATGAETAVGERPPDSFVAALRARGVGPISVGRVIVATWEPHETAVLETIRDQGLELQVIFNKGAVMILPAGVNKATGLAAALARMALSQHNTVGVGDAENDHALLSLCECGVAVANALPTLKQRADFVTTGDHGAGVEELIADLLKDDLVSRESELIRREILLGADAAGRELRLRPYGENVLALGGSAVAFGAQLLQRLAADGYSCCVIDASGDYHGSKGMVALGTAERAPGVDEVLKLLQRPNESGLINLTALSGSQRTGFFQQLMPRLGHGGRPHWLAFNAGSASGDGAAVHSGAGAKVASTLRLGQRSGDFALDDLSRVNLILASGESPDKMIREFCAASGLPLPQMEAVELAAGEVLAWRPRSSDSRVLRIQLANVPGTG